MLLDVSDGQAEQREGLRRACNLPSVRFIRFHRLQEQTAHRDELDASTDYVMCKLSLKSCNRDAVIAAFGCWRRIGSGCAMIDEVEGGATLARRVPTAHKAEVRGSACRF